MYRALLLLAFSTLAIFEFAQGQMSSHVLVYNTLPTRCNPASGDIAYKRSLPNPGLYDCPATNTWRLIAIGGNFTARGVWSAATTYAALDLVSCGPNADCTGTPGTAYVSLTASNLNHPPAANPANWASLSQQGPAGVAGAPGASVTAVVEPAGANCANGGYKFTISGSNSYVCNGAQGPAGSLTTTDATHNAAFTMSGTTSGSISFSVANIAGSNVVWIWPIDSAATADGNMLTISSGACPSNLPVALAGMPCRFLNWTTPPTGGGGGSTTNLIPNYVTTIWRAAIYGCTGTTFNLLGLNAAPSGGGTAAAGTTDAVWGCYLTTPTTAVTDNVVSFSASGAPYRMGRNGWLQERVGLHEVGSTAGIRTYYGFGDSTGNATGATATDTLVGGNWSGFTYSSSRSTQNWWCEAGNGTTAIVDSTVGVSADTPYDLEIQFDDTANTTTYRINGVTVCATLTTRPTANVNMNIINGVRTTEAVIKNPRWSFILLRESK